MPKYCVVTTTGCFDCNTYDNEQEALEIASERTSKDRQERLVLKAVKRVRVSPPVVVEDFEQ